MCHDSCQSQCMLKARKRVSFGACVWNKKAQLFLTRKKKDKTPLDFQRDFDLNAFFPRLLKPSYWVCSK
ncbi:hypothetical protein AAFF_G00357310 [Aldrovandia affinis]|uniref:Uncharacterized protein n=1 Tax=Aldrovandia affinis TaxID=143900 RepID=A0AAD7X188_9TELE|nr:hypothetical protein AAFF_G00357310 [Aldrovandia affinis]